MGYFACLCFVLLCAAGCKFPPSEIERAGSEMRLALSDFQQTGDAAAVIADLHGSDGAMATQKINELAEWSVGSPGDFARLCSAISAKMSRDERSLWSEQIAGTLFEKNRQTEFCGKMAGNPSPFLFKIKAALKCK